MGEGDGVYYSGSAYPGSRTSARRGNRSSAAGRLKKAAVAVVGLSAVGGGAYFAATVFGGHPPGYVSGGPAGPVRVAPSPPPSPSPTHPSPVGPTPGPQMGTRNGIPQSARPSPTPSVPDDQVAAAQVGAVLAAAPPPTAPGTGLGIASGPVTVSTETGTDGSSIRVVTARYDMTGRWSAPDPGRAVGDAHCTAKLAAVPGGPAAERPTMLVCWRMSPAKSVVTVAIRPQARPLAPSSVDALDRAWAQMG
jgi:hypothetical protein